MEMNLFIYFLITVIISILSLVAYLLKNIKKCHFIAGMFPSNSGKYCIILLNEQGKEIITVDYYDHTNAQWLNTKNPSMITHFCKYEG